MGPRVLHTTWRCPDGRLAVSDKIDSPLPVFAYIVQEGGRWLVMPVGGWKNNFIEDQTFASEQEALDVTLKILETVR